MTHKPPVYLNHMAQINALGYEHPQLLKKLIQGDISGMQPYQSKLMNKTFLVGQVKSALPLLPQKLKHHNTRNNRLLLHCLLQLEQAIDTLKQKYHHSRIGVIMGTSTSGIAEGEAALAYNASKGEFPQEFDYSQIQMSSPSYFIADYLGLTGPAYSISTACSSSGKVFASARSLIENDLCDALIVGGSDSLCDMTLHGFDSLEAISPGLALPFSANRSGINIGEGAALFIMTQEPGEIALLGVGESSDAHHISAPHPQGDGAVRAMSMALEEAQLSQKDIDYLNLHGTGTLLNDSMEAKAVEQCLSKDTLCSSTKPLTGHTLGAAGATELAFCWLLLQSHHQSLALHQYDGNYDPAIPKINLVTSSTTETPINTAMSNSFAFGGNNVSVIIGRGGITA